LKSIIKNQQQQNAPPKDEELVNEMQRLSEENEHLKIENAMLKRKYDIDDIEDDDCLMKRPKSETDDFKLTDIEFDELPGDDLSA